MKYIIIILAFLGDCYFSLGQSLRLNWMDQIGGPGWDVLSSMAPTPDGKLVVAGSFYDSVTIKNKTYQSKGSRDCFLIVYNPDGTIASSYIFGGKGYEYIKQISVCESGEIIAVVKFEREITIGDTELTAQAKYNHAIVCFDGSLNPLSQNIISGDQEFDITSLEKSNNKSTVFTGWFSGKVICGSIILETQNDTDVFQGKIDSKGKLTWLKQYKVAGADKAQKLKSSADGQAYLVGTTIKGNFDSAGKTGDMPKDVESLFVGSSNPEGKISSLIYPVYGIEIEPVDVLKDDNTIWVLANFGNTGAINGEEIVSKGRSDILLIRYDATTRKTIYYQLGGYGNDVASGMVKSGSEIIVAGRFDYEFSAASKTIKPGPMGPDIFIATFNTDCQPLSLISLNGDKIEFPTSIIPAGSGIYLGGSFTGTLSSTTTELKSRGEEDVFISYIENCNAQNPLHITATPVDPKNSSKGWELNAGDGYKSYSWNNGASPAQYYMATKPATYTVKVTGNNGCEYTSSIELPGTKSAQLPPDPIVEHDFSIYPTITTGWVTWQPSTTWLQKEANVYVTDISGKTVMSTTIKNLRDNSYSIDLSNSPTGTYIVHVQGDGFHESTKVVVNK